MIRQIVQYIIKPFKLKKGELMQTEKRKVTYWGGYREIEGRFEFYLDDFYCEEYVCPFCIKALAQYKHYNVVLNEDYLFGPDVSIWDFTINDLSCFWIWETDTWRSRIKVNGNPSSLKRETLEKIMQDLCDVLNMLVEKGEIESTDDTSSDWQPKHY